MELNWSEIKKVLNGSATANEVERFNVWFNESNEHKEYFEKIKYYYHNTEEAEESNKFAKTYDVKQIYSKDKKRTALRFVKIASPIAACLLVTFGLVNYYSGNDGHQIPSKELNTEHREVAKAENNDEIKLITESGNSYSVNSIINSIISNVNVTSDALTYQSNADNAEAKIEYHTIKVPHGKTFIIKLPDGTIANLNACSSLKYPTVFRKGANREVFLEGEGFFDVVKNENDQFIVKANDCDIIVYGTKFNVNCYDDDVETVLVNGSVGLRTSNGTERKIVPNQKLEFSKETGEITVSDVNVDKYISWQRNFFMFENEKLEDIAKSLRRWYNVDIVFANEEVKDILINCNTPRYISINDFLDVLKHTGKISYKIDNGKYILE